MKIRSRYYSLVGSAAAAGAGIYGVVLGVNHAELGAGFAVGWGCVATLWLYRSVRVALIEEAGSLVIRNFFSTRRIAWDDVESIGIKPLPSRSYVAVVIFSLRGCHRRRSASATTCFTRSRAQEVCNLISSRAQEFGVTCDLDPSALRSEIWGL
jgi:hypothetical protein